jgi:2-methylcitrate dehydratase PrpD
MSNELSTQQTTPLSSQLWDRYSRLTFGDVPESTLTVAKQCLLDWTACALAGSEEPLTRLLREEFAEHDGACSLMGAGKQVPPNVAALINGCAGHALDFDDTSTVMGGHPSAPVIPAALAVAELIDATGEQTLLAIIVGIEIESRLGTLIGGEHYARGWHATSTMGVFGAAAAVAYLMRLDNEQFGCAMGLAASQASGLKANFGTMTKPFHAGHAAERGLLSARLAARGFTSNPAAFEGNQGLVQAASTGNMTMKRFAAYDDLWLTEQVLFKYHAACYLTHASIECLANLGNIAQSANCEHLEITVKPSLLDVCNIEVPATGLEAKFSLRGTACLTMLGRDTTDPATFNDEVVGRSEMRTLIERVNIVTDDELASTQSRVRLTTKGRDVHETFFDTGIPATDLDLQQTKLEAKYRNLAGVVVGEQVDGILANIDSVAERGSIRNLFNPGAC